MKVYERFWLACDTLEAAGYSAEEAVALATAAVFPQPCAEDEVDLADPCPGVCPAGGPDDGTADGWYGPEDYARACVG
jgi:hypothetical protein